MRIKTFRYKERAVGQKLYMLFPTLIVAKNIFWSIKNRDYKTLIVAVCWLNHFRGFRVEWKIKQK